MEKTRAIFVSHCKFGACVNYVHNNEPRIRFKHYNNSDRFYIGTEAFPNSNCLFWSINTLRVPRLHELKHRTSDASDVSVYSRIK